MSVVERLKVHSISGYEWECDSCHYHFSSWINGERVVEICPECGNGITAETDGQYVDASGRVTDHSELVSLAHLKELLAEEKR